MTIEEIKVLAKSIISSRPERNLNSFEIMMGDFYKSVIEAVNELQWYREQDLIKRDDVIDIVGNEGCCDVCIRNKTIYNIDNDCQLNPLCVESEMKAIKQIPKAEPNIPKENI